MVLVACLLAAALIPAGTTAAGPPAVRTVAEAAVPVSAPLLGTAAPTVALHRVVTIDRSARRVRRLVSRYLAEREMLAAQARAQAAAKTQAAERVRSVSAAARPHAVSSGGFLACIRGNESDTAGGYQAVNPSGYYGAYQFSQSTWDNTARHIGRLDLVGKRPDQVDPATQDLMATALHAWQGSGPWAGDGC